MGSSTSAGYPYPLPTDSADLAGQLEALAKSDAALFCAETTEGVNSLTDLGRLWRPPGFTSCNDVPLVLTSGILTNISFPRRLYNNLHRGAEVPGPGTFTLPAGPEAGRTASWYMIGASINVTTGVLTANSLRQLILNLNLISPFTLAATTQRYTAVTYAALTSNSLVINEFIVAYSGTFTVQYYHLNAAATLAVAAEEARVWVQKLWPATGPAELS